MRGAPRRLLLLLLCAAACALKPIQRRRLLATSALLPASQAAALAPKPSPPPPPSYVREDVAGSPGDLRAYRLLRFASGLRVLLASDASARDATVAATVGAGQLREPVEGLSHLTEHLVMRAGDLEAVAASFDGNANAYTAFDCTTYVASCFPSRVGRLLAAYGDALSPRTADRFDGATAAARRGGGALASAAASLYRARYVAEDATVAVVAPIPLDLLERAARNLGSPLRDGPPPRPPRKPRDPLPALERGSNVVVASGRDVLSLTWSVPYESLGGADAYRRAKPCATRSAQWEEALTHALGAVAALRLTPLPLWKDAADECAPRGSPVALPPLPPTASELANDMRCADFDVLGARRYAAAPRDAALAASRFADLLTPERCRRRASRSSARTVRTKVDPAVALRRRLRRGVAREHRLPAGDGREAPAAGRRRRRARRGRGAGRAAVWIDRAPTKPGAAPRAKLVLWLPAARVAAATAASRAVGRLWQLRVDVALAEPLYDAALAGCKYEFAFLRAAPNAPGPAAGARVALAAYADVLPRFAPTGGGSASSRRRRSRRRTSRAKAFALLEPGLGDAEKRALADATEADVREAAALWNSAPGPRRPSARRSSPRRTPTRRRRSSSPPSTGLLPPTCPSRRPAPRAARDRPSRPRVALPPVAANACVASGVPGLLANCNVRQ
ncbi:M16 peptidase-like protein [Aureococcus anophagefferens]|nr:M16 peptidase-like protein [Aureococcus anophagefferens]